MGRVSPTSKMMQQLRFMVSECFEGGMLDAPRFYRIHEIRDKRRIGLMLGITRLVMCTDYCSESTKIWLSNPYITMKGVRLATFRSSGETVSESTIQSRVYYDSCKFCKDFSTAVITDVCEVISNPIDKYEEKLHQLLSEHEKVNMLSEIKIGIKFGEACNNSDITDEEFEEFKSIIVPYVGRVMQAVEGALDDKVCYYVNRLVRGEIHDEKGIERLKSLSELIYGPESKVE